MRPPAIILGGGLTALSLARSLASRGITVQVLDGAQSPARFSRAVGEFFDVGREDPQQRMLGWLGARRGPAVLLAGADDGIELIARQRSQLREWGYLPMEGDDEVLLAMLDKTKTYALAAAHGIAAPLILPLRTESEVERAIGEIDFPCVLKPVHSHLFARRVGGAKVLRVEDPVGLRAQHRLLASMGIEMFVTEVIRGTSDEYVSYFGYLDEDGQTFFDFTKRKLRQQPPRFGIGTYHETTADPEVAQAGANFLRAVGLRGLGNVEFKRDHRDGQLKLIECNARFTLVNELVRRAGVDLAVFAYNRLTGLPLPVIEGYRVGLRLWDPVNDARAFLAYRRMGELTTREWIGSLLHRQVLPAAALRDPLPAVVRMGWMARQAARYSITTPLPDSVASTQALENSPRSTAAR